MNAAIIPQYADLLNNQLFTFKEYNPTLPYGADRIGFYKLKEKFSAEGDTLSTIDQVKIADIDVCIFIDLNYYYLDKLLELDDPPFLVYIMREPPSVRDYNAESKITKYAPLFDEVFTWNDMLSESGPNFTKYRIPQYLELAQEDSPAFSNQKLLVNITSRKYSHHPEELYSAREEVIRYYDEHHPDQFTLYGQYWNQRPRLEDMYHYRKLTSYDYRTYRGLIDDKTSAYQRHKFTLCFENMTGINGYVTEKLFDCFRAGTVPVYWGANNISEIVPSSAFIDYRNYSSPQTLHNYLESVDKVEYEEYLSEGRAFILDNASHVSPEKYAETLHSNISSVSQSKCGSASSVVLEEISQRAALEQLGDYSDEMSTKERFFTLWKLVYSNPNMVFSNPSSVLSTLKGA